MISSQKKLIYIFDFTSFLAWTFLNYLACHAIFTKCCTAIMQDWWNCEAGEAVGVGLMGISALGPSGTWILRLMPPHYPHLILHFIAQVWATPHLMSCCHNFLKRLQLGASMAETNSFFSLDDWTIFLHTLKNFFSQVLFQQRLIFFSVSFQCQWHDLWSLETKS